MSFTNPAPLGGYITGDLIDESQINYWCSILPDCIDGAGGGTYTLSNPLLINGDDVSIGENLDVGTDLTTDGLIVTGATTIGSSTGDLLVVNSTSIMTTVTVGNSLTVSGNAILNGNATVAGTLTANGNTVLGNATSDTTTVAGPLQFLFKTSIAANADTMYTAADSGQVYFLDGSMGTNRAYTFTGSFTAGNWFLFKHRAAGGATHTINGLATVAGQGVLWIYNGTNWRAWAMSENFA